MANLKEWLLAEANGQEIEAVVIGEMGWGDYGKEAVPGYDEMPKNTLLSWAKAEKYLDYKFNPGYGAPGCQAVTAWTKDKVIFISQYDGATSTGSVPRNPIDHEPSMPGG